MRSPPTLPPPQNLERAPAHLDTIGVTLGYITDTVDSTRNYCMLKANTQNTICMIFLCYYAETKEIIYRSVNLKGAVYNN